MQWPEHHPAPNTPAALALCGLAYAGALWRWSSFLGRRPGLARVRGALLAVLAAATLAELGMCAAGHLQPWMAALILLINAWGPLDAVLRYPAVHDVDTFFTVKQVLLLCVKLVSFPFGFAELLDSLHLLVALSLLNFVALPVLYLVALPLDQSPEEQQRAAKGVPDVDLAVRLALLAAERRNWACSGGYRLCETLSPRKRTPLPLWQADAAARCRRPAARDHR